MKKGKIIVFESGTDGAGKTTQIELLYNRLKEAGYPVKHYKYPDYENESSTLIKMYLEGHFGEDPLKINPYAVSTFFAVDRFCGYQKWKDFYEEGGIVLLDRYTTSNMIHQTVQLDAEEREKYLEWLTDLEYNKFSLPKPDLVLFLNLNPLIALDLINQRNIQKNNQKVDIHENSGVYMLKSYENSLYISKKYKWTNIPCSDRLSIKSIDEIHELICDEVSKLIGLRVYF